MSLVWEIENTKHWPLPEKKFCCRLFVVQTHLHVLALNLIDQSYLTIHCKIFSQRSGWMTGALDLKTVRKRL